MGIPTKRPRTPDNIHQEINFIREKYKGLGARVLRKDITQLEERIAEMESREARGGMKIHLMWSLMWIAVIVITIVLGVKPQIQNSAGETGAEETTTAEEN